MEHNDFVKWPSDRTGWVADRLGKIPEEAALRRSGEAERASDGAM